MKPPCQQLSVLTAMFVALTWSSVLAAADVELREGDGTGGRNDLHMVCKTSGFPLQEVQLAFSLLETNHPPRRVDRISGKDASTSLGSHR